MGLRNLLQGKRVYFDSNIFIYLIEGFVDFDIQIKAIRDSILYSECEIMTCELTLCETLVAPYKAGSTAIIEAYREFIENSGAITLAPTNRETYILASQYRAKFGLKTPDAIHVASAMQGECHIFLSNDRSLRGPKNLSYLNLQSE